MARNILGFRRAVSAVVNSEEVVEGGSEFLFTITFPDNMSETKVGVNGSYVVLNSDTTAKVVISVLPNSIANDVFWGIYYNQRGALGGLSSITLIDDTGTSYECLNCSLENPAEITAGAAEADERKWGFGVGVINPPKG